MSVLIPKGLANGPAVCVVGRHMVDAAITDWNYANRTVKAVATEAAKGDTMIRAASPR